MIWMQMTKFKKPRKFDCSNTFFVSLYTSPIYRYIYGCETCGRCEIKTFSMVLFSVLVSFLGIVQKLLQVFEAQKI